MYVREIIDIIYSEYFFFWLDHQKEKKFLKHLLSRFQLQHFLNQTKIFNFLEACFDNTKNKKLFLILLLLGRS